MQRVDSAHTHTEVPVDTHMHTQSGAAVVFLGPWLYVVISCFFHTDNERRLDRKQPDRINSIFTRWTCIYTHADECLVKSCYLV